jgi:large subunit ribosomal protein L28
MNDKAERHMLSPQSILCYTYSSLELHPELIGRIMAMKCEYCGKGPSFGNVVSHANNTRRRRWNPNLKSVRAFVSGARKRVKVCTACIRAGKVKKAA